MSSSGARKKVRNAKVATSRDFAKRKTRFVLYNTMPHLPDEFDTVIPSGFSIENAGATAAVTGWIASNSLLTTSHSAVTVTQSLLLDELIRMYESYRVVAYELDYSWVSRSTVDSNWVMIHLNEDPAFATGSSFSATAFTYPNMFRLLVAANTKSPCAGTVKSPKIWLADIVGSDTFETDDNFAGTISNTGVFTAPAALTYAVYYSGQTTGAAFAASNSPYCSGVLRQFVKFYGRRA